VGALLADVALQGDSPLREFGRARHLRGFDVPFAPLRQAKSALDGQMIDVMLTAVAGAMGRWHRRQGFGAATEVLTLVPINLRPWSEQGLAAATGNRATGVLVKLPLGIEDPVARFREVHARVRERKASPALEYLPAVAEGLALLPRALVRVLSYLGSQAVNLIVTNVPGIMTPRWIAGARIVAGYPFAPLAPQCPVSIALYGYDGHLFVGIDADGTAMPDVDEFAEHLEQAFEEVIWAASSDRGGQACGE
jgi:diacylglycerol O-acyltransferase